MREECVCAALWIYMAGRGAMGAQRRISNKARWDCRVLVDCAECRCGASFRGPAGIRRGGGDLVRAASCVSNTQGSEGRSPQIPGVGSIRDRAGSMQSHRGQVRTFGECTCRRTCQDLERQRPRRGSEAPRRTQRMTSWEAITGGRDLCQNVDSIAQKRRAKRKRIAPATEREALCRIPRIARRPRPRLQMPARFPFAACSPPVRGEREVPGGHRCSDRPSLGERSFERAFPAPA